MSKQPSPAASERAMRAAEIRFIRGRLKFGNAKTGAPFPSCVVVFKSTGGAL